MESNPTTSACAHEGEYDVEAAWREAEHMCVTGAESGDPQLLQGGINLLEQLVAQGVQPARAAAVLEDCKQRLRDGQSSAEEWQRAEDLASGQRTQEDHVQDDDRDPPTTAVGGDGGALRPTVQKEDLGGQIQDDGHVEAEFRQAVLGSDLETMSRLLESGCDVNALWDIGQKDDTAQPIHSTALGLSADCRSAEASWHLLDRPDCVEILVAAGCPVQHQWPRWRTPEGDSLDSWAGKFQSLLVGWLAVDF